MYALGRKPKSGERYGVALPLGRFLTGVVPVYPPNVDHLQALGLTFGLYGNDRFGVCGPTSLANYTRMVTCWLTGKQFTPSQDDVFDLYRRSGNPNFDPASGQDDNGVVMQEMLDAARSGGFAGRPVICFAKVDMTNLDEVRAAVAIFGGVLLGVDLRQAQQDQTSRGIWDYVASPEWGGHAVLAGAYDDRPGDVSDLLGIITWAEDVECTSSFLHQQLDEAWVVVLPEHLGTKAFLEGVDVKALAQAYTALTGEPFPVQPPTPPEPPAPPVPPVAPPAPIYVVDQADLDLLTWLKSRAGKRWLRDRPLMAARWQHAVDRVLAWRTAKQGAERQ